MISAQSFPLFLTCWQFLSLIAILGFNVANFILDVQKTLEAFFLGGGLFCTTFQSPGCSTSEEEMEFYQELKVVLGPNIRQQTFWRGNKDYTKFQRILLYQLSGKYFSLSLEVKEAKMTLSLLLRNEMNYSTICKPQNPFVYESRVGQHMNYELEIVAQ